MSLKEKKAAERKAAEKKRALEALFKPLSEAHDGPEGADLPEASSRPEVPGPTAFSAPSEMPEDIPVGDTGVQAPEAAKTSVVIGLRAKEEEKPKGKRPAVEGSGGRKKKARKSRGETPIYKDKVASANLIATCAGPFSTSPRESDQGWEI